MAKAKIKKIEEILLSLTIEEARTLYIILNFIGGGQSSLRFYADSIIDSLKVIDVYVKIDENALFRAKENCLTFKENTLGVVGDNECSF